MTKEELSIERERFIYYYEKYPIKQGIRTDLNGGDAYNRFKLILDNFTHIWPNTITYISHNINKIYKHLKDDDDRLFFTRKLFHHKWKPVSLCKFVDVGYSKMDVENKFEDLLYNNEKISIKKTKELLSNYYKKNLGHLYVMKFESDSEYIPKTSVKKIGYSYDLQRRLKSISTWNPYTVVPMVYIIVEGYSDEEIERLVHQRFAPENYKLELFLDGDNKMVNEVIDFVSKLPNCKIKKMYTEKQLRLKYKIKTKTTDVFVPNYYVKRV
jgi:hypothetical protein